MTSSLSVARPLIHRTVLENGLVVIVIENPVADIISARMLIKVGTGHESRSQAGLFSLLASLLTKGTERLSSMEIAEQVESIGAGLSSDTSADYSLLSLKTVSADFEEILALSAELLRHPSFPEEELDLERRLTLQSIRSMQEQPFTVAYNALRTAMYGEHPYGLPDIGTEESIAGLTRDDVKTAHATYFRPDNCVMVVAGRITPERAVALATENFGDWVAPETPIPPLVYPALPEAATHQSITQATNQAIVIVGYPTPCVKDSAYAALKLVSTYLGNGLSSRLFVELREKRGLAYDVSAFYPTRLSQSQFVAYMGTAPENTTVALEGLRYETERLCQESLASEELDAAKNKLLGQYALGKQTNAQIAQLLAWYEVLGLGIDFDQAFQDAIAAVTADTLQTVAQAYFTQPFTVLLGPNG
ncbi:MAG: insulinase family protein [Leptolyngbya sp. SIO1E4]|nr:insulinase family protein [Leptolyngbya sp. SIO1E4]